LVLPCSGIPPESVPELPQHRIYSLHQKILADLQKTWFQPLPSKHQVQRFGEYEDELDSILDTIDSSWLVQDTLLNHFLPLWLSRVDNPVLFLYFSEPLECAHALQQKWRFPISFGLALWESYMLAAANNLIGQQCIPVSRSKLRRSPKKVMKAALKKAGEINQANGIRVTENDECWSALSTGLEVDLSLYSGFLQKSQKDIFKHLENGEIEKLEGRALAPQSTDILDYYGQLRAGFELLRTKQNQFEERTDQEDSEQTAEISSTYEPPETGIIPDAGSMLREVIVHIKGIEPIEFIVEADSPVLQMLRHSLQSSGQAPDEMVYLDYEDKATSALYFMKSSLLGIETTPLLH